MRQGGGTVGQVVRTVEQRGGTSSTSGSRRQDSGTSGTSEKRR